MQVQFCRFPAGYNSLEEKELLGFNKRHQVRIVANFHNHDLLSWILCLIWVLKSIQKCSPFNRKKHILEADMPFPKQSRVLVRIP